MDEEMMTADADVKETTVGARAITQETVVDVAITTKEPAVETAAQTTMDATAGQIFVLSPVLSKGPLCSTRTQDADVRNLKIITATVNNR